MVDTKISALTELAATPDGADLLAIIDDPAGTPVSKKITVTNLLAAGGGLTFARVVKTADETVSNSSTLQNDNSLLFAVSANKTYAFCILMFADILATSDFKYGLSLPASATANWMKAGGFYSAGSLSYFTADATNAIEVSITNPKPYHIMQWGEVITGASSGTVNFQWCQKLATVEDTKMLKGSMILAWEG